MKLEIKRIDQAMGVILPTELLTHLKLGEGEVLYVTELPDRAIKLSPHDSHFEEGMRIAREMMEEYEETLKALSKT